MVEQRPNKILTQADLTATVVLSASRLAGVVVIALLLVAILYPRDAVPEKPEHRSKTPAFSLEMPASASETSTFAKPGEGQRFETVINRPAGPPTIELKTADPQGRVGNIACSTCHSVREPNFANRSPADLDQFHQDMPMTHGSLTCYSCHNPSDADTLRLADTTVVEYPEVMTLCSQCHGTQARDYQHGAHGGMTGYWDLSRGPRARNNCIDCHDPHAPQFPSMVPTFKPRDRFLTHKPEANHE